MTELPVEILASVFLHVLERRKLPRQERNADLEAPPDTNSLYAAMLVCRRWRDVAIGSPELWRALPPSITREAAALFLRRSCSLPLCAYTDAATLSLAAQRPLYLESPYNMRLVELHVVPSTAIWTFSLPLSLVRNLVFLDVRCDTTGPCIELRLLRYPLFGGTNPTLRALTITPHVFLPSDSFPALAHLRMTGPRSYPIAIMQLLCILEHMPALETLYLSAVAMHAKIDAQSARPVELARLQALCVEPRISTRAAVVFLSCLVLPRRLNYQLHQLHVRPEPLEDVVYVPPLDALSTLELIESDDRRLHIRARGPAHGFWLHFVPGSKDYSLRERFLGPMLAKLRPMLRDVTTLRVAAATFDSGFLASLWPHVSHSCPSLTALVVVGPRRSFSNILPAVGDALSPTEAPRGVPWEALDCLALQLGDLDTDLLPLADVLARRAQHGCRLRSLTISQPRRRIDAQMHRQRGHIEALEAHVDQVDVTEEEMWDIADDALWKVESAWWPLYPRTEAGMREGWGLHGVVGRCAV
ncbi:hypothetical protein C8T65DRAFT_824897 [Cerioporus squamosus]|nr:hypothetical protein C8T65DRAFT_824897 [Cerioporus squamosus]